MAWMKFSEREEKISEKMGDAIGNLIEKMVPVLQELGLDAEAEAPILLDDLRDVLAKSLDRAWHEKYAHEVDVSNVRRE